MRLSQIIDAKPDLRNPKTALALILIIFSGGIFFFTASKFNDMVIAELDRLASFSPMVKILILLGIASFLSTIAYIILQKKGR